MASIREKPHRLVKEFYRGSSIVAFTLCLKNRATIFKNPDLVDIFIGFLKETVTKFKCKIPIYCFMPDHLHLIITGIDGEADFLKAVSIFKQKTGFWIAKNKVNAQWQKDFFDHVIKKGESLATNIKYILDNPVRKGIVTDWQEYPFKAQSGTNWKIFSPASCRWKIQRRLKPAATNDKGINNDHPIGQKS